jgi:putative addiction module component (TIGR02574 family)
MSVSIESLGIDQLSVGDRLELIDQIWESLPEQLSPQDIPDWHLAELAKRRAAAEREPGRGKLFREVLAKLGTGE